MKKQLPIRKNLRLNDYDYSQNGIYFITFCTHKRKKVLSNLVGAIHESPTIKLSLIGQKCEEVIKQVDKIFNVTIDNYVIMPNHVHLLIQIKDYDNVRAIHESPLQQNNRRSTISKIVGYVKMQISKSFHQINPDFCVWQRGFYDHVVRNEKDYEEIYEYISNNPLKWQLDKYYCE